MTDEAGIWDAVVACNRAWFQGRPREVGPLFHEDAVGVFLDAHRRVEGRDAIVQSYVDYCEHAKTHAFEETEHSVDVFGDVAVVHYRFTVRYESEGRLHDEVGQEILVFVRREGMWRVRWRTQVVGGQ